MSKYIVSAPVSFVTLTAAASEFDGDETTATAGDWVKKKVMTIEASAPAAKMGNLQFFWWGVLILTFFLPYGLISAELGTAYKGQGGIYEWVKKAYGISLPREVCCQKCRRPFNLSNPAKTGKQ